MPAPNLEELDRRIIETRKAFFEARSKLVRLADPASPDPDGAADGLIAEAAEFGLTRTLDNALREPAVHGLALSTPADQLTSSLGAAYDTDQALDLLMRDRNRDKLNDDPSYKPRVNLFGRDVELDFAANRARDLESAETYALPNPDAVKRRRREKSK